MIRLKNLLILNKSRRFYSTRTNEVGVQMVNEDLRAYIFGNKKQPSSEDIQRAREHLKEHNLADKKVDYLKDVTNIELPKLIGNQIDNHFNRIASKQIKNYFDSLCKFANECELPQIPTKFEFSPGWTKYSTDGKVSKVSYPNDKALVFDVETLVQDEMRPVIATAVSSDAWYSWCSEALFNKDYNSNSKLTLDDLIPFESDKVNERFETKRVLIGHNVGFDRSFIREQYFLEKSSLRFLDTMSMHISCTGFSSEQRSGLNSQSVAPKGKYNYMKRQTSDEWKSEGSLNNLKDIHKFYCKYSQEITKDVRNIFIKGSINDVKSEFQSLMIYCANDVRATYEVFAELFKRYLDRFPHPITLAGMLEMSTMYLPTNRNWFKYVNNCKNAYDDAQYLLKNALEKSANEACEFINYKDKDPWLFDLNWSLKEIKFNKKSNDSKVDIVSKTLNLPNETNLIFKLLSENDKLNVNTIKNELKLDETTNEILKTAKQLPKINQHLCNYPNWYRELCLPIENKDWKPGPCLITTKLRLTPNLLRLKWNNKPLIYENSAWFFFDPYKPEEYTELPQDENTGKKKKRAPKDILIKKINFDGNKIYKLQKIPHKDGEDLNVGNPLSKSFLTKLKEGTLSSEPKELAELALRLYSNISYWENNEKRITSQKVIKINTDNTNKIVAAILPQTIVAGTITRRAVESTWLTASNYKKDRIGGELKTMVQCPDGYVFVGADVDSQELWIASTIGDSSFTKIHGSTAVSWMNLQGKKSDGTDIHSKTASIIGISRDQAKVFNYGRIYGAGKKFAEKLLLQFNPLMTTQEAAQKANIMYESTKGKRKTELTSSNDQQNEIVNDVKETNKTKIKKWTGGTESEMFNKLEEIAKSAVPKTPVLNASITKCLEPHLVEDDFMTSRINWVVQSSAVDYLHIMLVCMNWLIEKYEIDARFSISIHDEIRYIVKEEDKYRAALALQITNLMTRSLFAYKLGFDDLPMSIAFFSGVDIDKCLRKEPDLDFVCPSNPNGLHKGYGIAKGECLDIYKILDHTNGRLSKK